MLRALRAGIITLDDCITRYALSPAEVLEWSRRLEKDGLRGLKAKW